MSEQCVNTILIDKYLREQDLAEQAYNDMMEKLTDALLEELDALKVEHDLITKSYGIDQSFIDTIKEIL